MMGRVGRAASHCLLAVLAGLTLVMGGCQRAKPERVLAMPPVYPRGETPVVAQVALPTPAEDAMATPTDGTSAGYPAPEPPASATPTAVTLEPTATPVSPPIPTATLAALPTSTPVSGPTIALTPGPTPTPVMEVVYRVKAGDSLGSIAVLYNTTAAAIMARNNLSNPSMIHVGQTLIIPAADAHLSPRGSTVLHTVASGETLADIAVRYRTTPEAIMSQNPSLDDPDQPPVGAVLMITIGSEPGNRTHIVRPGESLSTIAESYGLTTQQVARANGLTDPSRIRVGQLLIIP